MGPKAAVRPWVPCGCATLLLQGGHPIDRPDDRQRAASIRPSPRDAEALSEPGICRKEMCTRKPTILTAGTFKVIALAAEYPPPATRRRRDGYAAISALWLYRSHW